MVFKSVVAEFDASAAKERAAGGGSGEMDDTLGLHKRRTGNDESETRDTGGNAQDGGLGKVAREQKQREDIELLRDLLKGWKDEDDMDEYERLESKLKESHV